MRRFSGGPGQRSWGSATGGVAPCSVSHARQTCLTEWRGSRRALRKEEMCVETLPFQTGCDSATSALPTVLFARESPSSELPGLNARRGGTGSLRMNTVAVPSVAAASRSKTLIVDANQTL